MILEDKADILVPKVGQCLVIECEWIDPVQLHVSATGGIERTENMKQRALSTSTRPGDSHGLAGRDLQVDSPENLDWFTAGGKIPGQTGNFKL